MTERPSFPPAPGTTRPATVADIGPTLPQPEAEDAADLRSAHLQRAEHLLDRARARRERALTTRDQGIATRLSDLASRDLCVVQTTTDGRSVTNHIFPEVPRLGTLIARTGPDVFVLSVRVQTPEK